MPVTLDIRENGRVSYYVISDPWTTSELMALYPQDSDHRNSVSYVVHSIMNVSGIKRLPTDVIRARQNAPGLKPNSGQLVMVGANAFARRTAETIFRLAHYNRARFFDTEEQAWSYLRRMIQSEGLAAHRSA
jgi:hypothetical protein